MPAMPLEIRFLQCWPDNIRRKRFEIQEVSLDPMESADTARSGTSASNVEIKQRVLSLDVLRGLALLGMLLVHFQYYVQGSGLWSDRIGRLISFIAEDRFYPLFAVLFGAGFTLQLMRWGARPGFVVFYLRRIAALMVFAFLLIGLTGYRVLESYAFWALPLLAIRRWSNRALVILILVCAFAHPAVDFATWHWEKRQLTLEQSNAKVEKEIRYWPDAVAEADRLRDEGNFAKLVPFQLQKSFGQYLHWKYYVPGDPLLMFLFGMLAVRFKIFQEPLRYRKLLTAFIVIGVFAGIMSVFADVIFRFGSFGSFRLAQAARKLTYAIFDERFQGLAYAAATLLWMAASPASQRLTRFLANPGRLSLTNYIVQIAILEIFFASSHSIIPLNRWGTLVGVVLVFALQIAFSRWWIARFRYGPLEWLWRSASFARWEPLRREQTRSAAAVRI